MIKAKKWKEIPFEKICKDVSKRTSDPQNSGFSRYVGLEHLDTLEPRIRRWGSTEDVNTSMNLFKKDQILFGRRNWYLRRVALSDFDGVCSADIYVLEPIDGEIIPEFLPIFMHTDQFFEKTMQYSGGSMSTRVKWSRLSTIKFQIPDIPFQQQIVRLIKTLDETISNNQDVLFNLAIYKTSFLNDVFQKGIHHEKTKPVTWVFGNKSKIPISWDFPQFSSIVHTKIKIKNKQEFSKYAPMDAINIEHGNVDYFETRTTSDYSSLDNFEEADILFANITPSTEHGKVAIVKNFKDIGLASTELRVFRTKSESVLLPKFLFYFLKTPMVREHSVSQMTGGTGRQRVPDYVFAKDLHIPLPMIDEQKDIISKIDNLYVLYSLFQNNLTNLKTLRKSFLKHLLLPKKSVETLNV